MLDIWQKSLEALQRKLPRDHFEDLSRSVSFSRSAGNTLTLQVGGRLQRDWIHEHYLELLTRELEHQAGSPIALELEIVQRPNRPAATLPRNRRAPESPTVPARPVAPRPLSHQPPPLPCSPFSPTPPAQVVPAPLAAPLSQVGTPAMQTVLQGEHDLDSPSIFAPPLPHGQDEERSATPLDVSLASEARLNPRYTLSSFVVGPSNQMAHAACVGVSQKPGGLYNPLFLYGNSGLGKTHLLQAVGHRLLQDRPYLRVVYRSTEDFINDFTRSLRNQRMEAFRRFYREECDLLLLDDVQFMSRKEQTQQEFFHTFEALRERGAQIVMTCDRVPREIDALDDRLRSRFTWGLLADIQIPELETRIAIVHKKAELDHLPLDEEAALFLASNFRSNIRELEGSLTRLGAYASIFARTHITADFAREVLKDNLPRSKQLSIEDAIKLVADHFRIKIADLKGNRRQRTVARPRQVAMYLVREVLQHSYPEIGRAFGKDHTTVISACRKVEELLSADSLFGSEVENLKRRIGEGT